MGGFFITAETYTKTVKGSGGEEGTVTLRRLNAGDQAAIQDTLRMSLDEGSDASLAIGSMRMLSVERALIDWDWDGPKPSPEAISQLEPEVFEQIYSFVEIGTPPTPEQKESPSTDGETPKAETAKKTRPKAAAAS